MVRIGWLTRSILFVLALGVLGSCGAPKQGGEEVQAMGSPEKGDWVVVHLLSDPEGLNPITTNDAAARDLAQKIYESLLEIDFDSVKTVPNLAEALPTISEDHLSYTFKLKKNVTFSDGKPLTAKDFVFSIKAAKNPLLFEASALRNYFADVSGVETPDDHTIVVRLAKPYFMMDLQLGGLHILPKHVMDPEGLTDQYSIEETNNPEKAKSNPAVEKFAKWFGAAERKREKQFIVGSGPYLFQEWRTGESIKLVRNEKYWNGDNNANAMRYPNVLMYVPMRDRNTALVALKAGKLDFIPQLSPRLWVESLDTTVNKDIVKTKYVVPVYSYLGWNARRPMFADTKTRQALSHLVDRDRMIKTVMLGLAEPTNGPIYRERPEYDQSIRPYEYNPAKAKELLVQAGWTDSDGDGVLDKMIGGQKQNFKFTFMVNDGNEVRENVAILLSDEFKKVGIVTEVRRVEWTVFQDLLRTGDYDAYMGAWINDPIPSDPYQIWHSSQIANKGSNYVAFSNKRVDEILQQNRIEFDEAKRIALMREFQQIVSNEQPYTFLWLSMGPAAYHNRFRGVRFSSVRPGYNPNSWWVPSAIQKYSEMQ